MTCTIEKIGRRHYIAGNTYPIKDQLKAAGCNYDPARKQWWTGKREVAEQFDGQEIKSSGSPNQEPEGENTTVAGKAEYKGRAYYLVGRIERGRTAYDDSVRPITTRDGTKHLLCFRDGSKQFWAAGAKVTKRYSRPHTIRGLRQFAEQAKSNTREYGSSTCAECGSAAGNLTPAPDSSGIVAPICGRCLSQTTQYERSYC